jgi:hypothetical protein
MAAQPHRRFSPLSLLPAFLYHRWLCPPAPGRIKASEVLLSVSDRRFDVGAEDIKF